MCIGLQYETLYYIDGSMSGTEYGVMGLSILVALFYMVASYLLSISYWEKMGNTKEGINPILAGGLFISGWLSSFANTYIHNLLTDLFPDSSFLNALENAIVAPLVEEPLKLLPLAFVLYLIPVKKLKSVFLMGIASGLGFQIIEDISYIRTDLSEGLAYTLSRILERVTSAIASHWTFSGLAILGIYLLYRAYRGQKAMIKPGFSYLGLAFGTHFLFNSPIVELETEVPLAFLL